MLAHLTFVIVEEVERPAHGLDERAVALGRAASPGQQTEALAERVGDLTDRERLRPRRRQLDRQRQTVESLADVQDVGFLGLARREAGTNGAGPFDEQLAGEDVVERLDGAHVLAADGQALAARRQHRHGRRRRHDALDQRRRGVDHVLAVVEHEQHASPAQRFDEPRLEWDLGPRVDAEGGGDGGDDLVAASHGRQLAERDMVEAVEIGRLTMTRRGVDGVRQLHGQRGSCRRHPDR